MTKTLNVPKAYGFDPMFEKQVVTVACSNPRFWGRIGTHLDPELFMGEPAKMAMRAARGIEADIGHGPKSVLTVVQRLRRWMDDGKVTLEAIRKVSDMFDAAEDAGLASEEELVSEIAPMLQQRLRDQAVKAGIESYGKKGDLSRVVELEQKALRIGQPHAEASIERVTLDEVIAKPISWVWEGWVARGKLMILDGDPGLGKSTLTTDLAARVSAGMAMPFQANGRAPQSVLLLCAEDSAADTLRPRVEAAGGDLEKVHVIVSPLSFPDGLDALARHIEQVRPALIIIDPLMAFLGKGVDSHRDQDVRRVLTPLARLAELYDVAISFSYGTSTRPGTRRRCTGAAGASASSARFARAPSSCVIPTTRTVASSRRRSAT